MWNSTFWLDVKLLTLSFLCLQSFHVQSEDYDDSSVVDSGGFVPDGVAGQSNNRHSGDNSSLNSSLNV